MAKERVVVFTGAGVSAESGLRTFRDGDGLWEEYRIEDVATPEAWARDPELVLRFYDERRAQVLTARPNAAHFAIARLEEAYDVTVVTQNIDDLHERAGSSRIIHLHGEVMKARSTADPTFITPVNGVSLQLGALCPLGSQLRPHIVWFGEEVPMLPLAAEAVEHADRMLVVGTSLQVYPAAGLVHFAPPRLRITVVDPKPMSTDGRPVQVIRATATDGVPRIVAAWLAEAPTS